MKIEFIYELLTKSFTVILNNRIPGNHPVSQPVSFQRKIPMANSVVTQPVHQDN